MTGPSRTELEAVVRQALAEDVGAGDLTTQATVPPGTRARARITQKQEGVLFGLDAAEVAFALLDPDVDEALEAGAPRILLDNMAPDAMRAIVARVGDRAELEASGNITLATIRAVAETGVHFISVGALTHSAPALDLSLLLEPLP